VYEDPSFTISHQCLIIALRFLPSAQIENLSGFLL